MNKGEWSEAYALIKLLSDKKLYIGDKDFKKVEGMYYLILQILKHESGKTLQFTYDDQFVVVEDQGTAKKIPLVEFMRMAETSLAKIKTGTGSFDIPEISEFFDSFNASHLPAHSTKKQDLTVQIQDPNTFLSPALGFSIKSQLGGSSTLFNASGATNITYRILGPRMSDQEVEEVNSIGKFSQKLKKIKAQGRQIVYEEVENKVFKSNLQTIDTHFDKVLALLTLYYYEKKQPINTVSKFTELVTLENPLNYDIDLNPSMYVMMVKKLLIDAALGMRPASVWQRVYEATGGYLVVRTDGEVLCYHFYFTTKFEEYLFTTTKFETPSSTRHRFGKVYEENGLQKIKLNTQIRFIV